MLTRRNSLAGLAVFAVGLGGWAIAYAVFQVPTELIQYDPAKASPGYTMFSPFRGRNTYLIDMHGNVVHYWPYPEGWSTPGAEAVEKHARLLEDGTLLRGAIDRTGRGGMSGAIYQIYDWDGEVIWEHDEERPGYTPHHDFRMIWNPKLQARTLLYVASREMTHEQAIALGVDPTLRDDYTSRPDGVVEVDMDGNVIWEWNITDHLVQDVNDKLPNYGVVSEHREKMDPNFANGASGDWIHINSLDYNQVLDHVVVNNSSFSESYIIDHGGTFVPGDPQESIALAASDAGDILYRWGNPCVYDAGRCPTSINEGQSSTNGHQQVFFSHDIQWVREREIGMGDNLPGAGNMLIFNNGCAATGGDVLVRHRVQSLRRPHGRTAFTSQRWKPATTWCHQAWAPANSYPNRSSGAFSQPCRRRSTAGTSPACNDCPTAIRWFARAPTDISSRSRPRAKSCGNTSARWETVPDDKYGIHTVMSDAAGERYNALFKCVRYPPDYAGLEGKDLMPMGKITELWTQEPATPQIDSQ